MRRPGRTSLPRGTRALAVVVGVACLVPSATTARAEGDDHAATQALVNALAADTAHASITGELLDHARRELERANGLRGVYDERRAHEADGAAREWAETARDVLRAVEAEAKAGEVRKKALDAQAQVDRTRALVDEDTARIGRLKAELENAEKEAKGHVDPDRRAVEVHEGEPAPQPHKKAGAKGGASAKGTAPGGAPGSEPKTGPRTAPDPTGGRP